MMNVEDATVKAIGTYRAVWQQGLRVRAGVELDSKVVESYPPGACFDVFEQVGSRLRTPAGWVSELHRDQVRRMAERIDECVPVIARYRVIWKRGIRVRSGKEVDSPIVALMPLGTRFEVIERDVTYGRVIRLRTRTGWVSAYHSGGVRRIAERVDAHWRAPKCPAIIAGSACPDGEWCPFAEKSEQCCAPDCKERLLEDKLEEGGLCAMHTILRKPSLERRSFSASTAWSLLCRVHQVAHSFERNEPQPTSMDHTQARYSEPERKTAFPEEGRRVEVVKLFQKARAPGDEACDCCVVDDPESGDGPLVHDFDGDWQSRFEPHAPITIRAGIVTWPDGSNTKIVAQSSTSFTAVIRSLVFTADLQNDSLLAWSDGDIWLRYQEDDDSASAYTDVSCPDDFEAAPRLRYGSRHSRASVHAALPTGPESELPACWGGAFGHSSSSAASASPDLLPAAAIRSSGSSSLQRFSIDTPRRSLAPSRLSAAEPAQVFVMGTPTHDPSEHVSFVLPADEGEDADSFAHTVDYTGDWWNGHGSLVRIEGQDARGHAGLHSSEDEAAEASGADTPRRSAARRATDFRFSLVSAAGVELAGTLSADGRHVQWSDGTLWSRDAPSDASEPHSALVLGERPPASRAAGSPSLEEQHAFLDAAKRRDFAAVRVAVERTPAIVNVQPSGRWSALHQAAEAGDEAAVRFLLDRGADRAAEAGDGQTPLALAADASCRELLAGEASADRNTAEGVARELPPGPRVCVLGGTEFTDPDTEVLVEAIARRMAGSLTGTVVALTGGMPGVQAAFAKAFGASESLIHLLPEGQASQFGVGRDVSCGSTLKDRMDIFGQLGHVYLTFEGGPGVAKEARAAFDRGAFVLPMISTGGASGGMFDFPRGALERPAGASEAQWACVAGKTSVEQASAAVIDLISARLEAAAIVGEPPPGAPPAAQRAPPRLSQWIRSPPPGEVAAAPGEPFSAAPPPEPPAAQRAPPRLSHWIQAPPSASYAAASPVEA